MRVMLTTAEDIRAFSPGSAKAYPKLGLLSLIAWVRDNLPDPDRVEFEYHDVMMEGFTADDIAERVRQWQPDIVGLSCLSFSERAFHAMAAAAKKGRPDCIVVGGGPYVSSLRAAVLQDPNVDVLVLDEGEEAFCELLRRLLDGAGWEDTRGIAFRGRSGVVTTPAHPLLENLDRLPLPAFDYVDFDRYARFNPHLDGGGRFAPIVTSRGCPFGCIYCHALHGKNTRFRSADAVVDDFKRLHDEFGVDLFYVYDDIFNLDVDRAKEICRRLAAADLDIAIDFLNGLRADILDHELIDLMLACGTYYFAYAVETAVPRLQKLIKKHNRLDRVADAIRYTVEAGGDRCVVATYNMIGFPTETPDEVRRTMAFNNELPHHIADVAVAIPQENTPMFTLATSLGFSAPETRTPNYGKDVLMSASEKIPPAELAALLHEFKRGFFDPRRQDRLHRLAQSADSTAQTRYLGAFVRGYLRMSGAYLGDTNASLFTGLAG